MIDWSKTIHMSHLWKLYFTYASRARIPKLNVNGIGNKVMELGVALERNMVKVSVIQESKLKLKIPSIWNYTTVRKDSSHGQGRGLHIFIHRSITLSVTAIVTRVAIWSLPGETYHTSWIMEYEFDHFPHLHSSSQLFLNIT